LRSWSPLNTIPKLDEFDLVDSCAPNRENSDISPFELNVHFRSTEFLQWSTWPPRTMSAQNMAYFGSEEHHLCLWKPQGRSPLQIASIRSFRFTVTWIHVIEGTEASQSLRKNSVARSWRWSLPVLFVYICRRQLIRNACWNPSKIENIEVIPVLHKHSQNTARRDPNKVMINPMESPLFDESRSKIEIK
jgi:hypothetical protein